MKPRSIWTALALCGALGSTTAGAQLLTPLAHVQVLEPLEGKTVYLKQVRCEAPGKPETLGRVYLSRAGSSFQAARVEYNDQGKFVLEKGRESPSVYKYFDKYVTQRQPFNMTTMNAIIGLWKLFGMRFKLDDATYSCQMS